MKQKTPTKPTNRAGHWVVNFVQEELGVESGNNASEIPNSGTVKPLKRHPEFFFDNTLIAIQVEDTLFNVHKYQLVKSEVFSDMFNMPKSESDMPEEGSLPEHPIKLEGVSASDFVALLRVLYANQFSGSQITPEASLVIPAFRLANMFNFPELRSSLLPIAEKNLDDVSRIVFAREFDIKEWLAPAHIRLCKREAVLSIEEANKLGAESVLAIWRMREQYRGKNGAAYTMGAFYCKSCAGLEYRNTGVILGPRCEICNASPAQLCCIGPGKVGTETTTNDTALEADVKKWVEDSYAAKG